MKRRSVLAGLLILGFAIGIFTPRMATISRRNNPPSRARAQEMPEHVAYRLLFHRVAALKRKADEIEQKGEKTMLRSAIKQDAQLTDEQANAPESIALDCERNAALQDAKAKQIIDAFRARYPGGRTPHRETPPTPPPEIDALQQERNAIILRARDRLHAALGEMDFLRLDEFAKRRNTNAQAASPSK